jgi:curved DNA-binding protein CbpA
MGDDHLYDWLDALDEMSYYDLFGLRRDASADEVHDAFHGFCDMFHPDRHAGSGDEERHAVLTIFKRGTEAYGVLGDPGLRAQYDAQLAATPGSPHPPRVSFSPLSRPPSTRAPGTRAPLDESVRAPSARPFARRAEELLAKGDLRQAKLQLVIANHMDAGNETLEAALRDLDEKLGLPGK